MVGGLVMCDTGWMETEVEWPGCVRRCKIRYGRGYAIVGALAPQVSCVKSGVHGRCHTGTGEYRLLLLGAVLGVSSDGTHSSHGQDRGLAEFPRGRWGGEDGSR